MANSAFLPTLSSFDIERAAQLIQQAYAPPTPNASPDLLRRLQQELFEIQKRPEAWGLVVPLLEHHDQNVQFFGAHTAQVKIARDWDSFPPEQAQHLRELILQLGAHSLAIGRGRFILRKLFVALTSLALKLAPGHPSRWPDWILQSVAAFSTSGATPEHIHEFLAIVAEEIGSADLLEPSKAQMRQTLADATPMVVQAITGSINSAPTSLRPTEVQSALRCLQAWMPFLPTSDLTPLIPILINLLNPSFDDESIFVASSDALQEIMTKSALSDGSGSKTLTEPLLLWMDSIGNRIVEETSQTGVVGEISHSLCKLLVAFGDHSTTYAAKNIASTALVSPSLNKTQGQLVQNFLRLVLVYTGLPGHYGVDEEESEMTLGFWYLFQEALWTVENIVPEDIHDDERQKRIMDARIAEQVVLGKAVYVELVRVLRRKVTLPGPGNGWSKDQVDKFQVYRRDVGDTLVNAYYILQDDLLQYYASDIAERLDKRQENDGWQDIEATLHCIIAVQEALDLERTPHLGLPRLFSPEILGRLPSTGHDRIRRTTLSVIGTYSTWFSQSEASGLLMTVISHVVLAITDPALCLQGALALRNLCDSNRKALAPHISAFADLHAGLERIPESERSKILQSIASVIQAMPPDQEISPIEAIVNPIITKLAGALQSAPERPDEARALAILQLEILAGVAKGLTRTMDALVVLEESTESSTELERVKQAREDPRMVKLREEIFVVVRGIAELWSTDAEVGHALSDLFKSITCLPSDTTLITLPAGPLLELVCLAAQRRLTAAWLSLAAILIAQLYPPSFSLTLKSGPVAGAEVVVANVLPVLLYCTLGVLGQPGAMEANPDIVQAFFSCMDGIAKDFTSAFYNLPQGGLDTLMDMAVRSLSLQERWSLVHAAAFVSTLIHRSSVHEELVQNKEQLLATHGRALMRAVLEGFASVAPRSAVLNLIEVLSTLLGRAGDGTGRVGAQWMREILFAEDFVPSKAGPDAKEKLIKTVLGSRSTRKTRDAANQFTLIARGLEGSNFGYASVGM